MIVVGGACFLFGLYNAYNFLYRLKKHRQWANVGIYITALLCLALNITYAIIVPFDNYCNITWFVTSYGAAYCDGIVGTCQAYMLSTLKTQLTCLFNFQTACEQANNLQSIDRISVSRSQQVLLNGTRNSLEQTSIREVKESWLKWSDKRMRLINIIVIVAVVFQVCMFAVHLGFIIHALNELKGSDRCLINNFFHQAEIKNIESVYHWTRCGMLALINFWLISSTFLMLQLIRKLSQCTLFRMEFLKIGFAYWSFVFGYTAWLVFYIVESSIEFVTNGRTDDFYQDQIFSLTCSGFLFSVVPIFALFLIHFFSFSSIGALHKIARPVEEQERFDQHPQSAHEMGPDQYAEQLLEGASAGHQPYVSVLCKVIDDGTSSETVTNESDVNQDKLELMIKTYR